jgi:hypothetical protein
MINGLMIVEGKSWISKRDMIINYDGRSVCWCLVLEIDISINNT